VSTPVVVVPASPEHPEVIEVDGIRKFRDPTIQSQLDDIIARIPPGENAFELGVTLNEQKDVLVMGVVRLGEENQFSIMAAFQKKWEKPVTAQVMLGWVG
jgi:hypothetical protein